MVAVGERPAQAAEGDDVGVPGARPQNLGVTAADREPDPASGGQGLACFLRSANFRAWAVQCCRARQSIEISG